MVRLLVQGLLVLLVVGVGLPIMGALFLSWNRHKMERVRFKHAAGFLYEGYRRGMPRTCCGGFWYWELLVVTLRKVLLLIVAVTVSQPFLQSALILLVLTLSLLLQVRAQPYTSRLMNGLDMAGMASLALLALLGLSQADGFGRTMGLSGEAAGVLSGLVTASFLAFFAAVVAAAIWRSIA